MWAFQAYILCLNDGITTPLSSESYENLLKKARTLYESETSVTAISRIMGKARTTIYKWIGIFEKEQEEAPMPKEKEANQQQSPIERCTDEMINVAEAKFKISMRKKSWRQAVENLHARDPKRYGIKGLCALFGVSKQAYYQHDENRVMSRAAEMTFALEYAQSLREMDPGMEIKNMWYMYHEAFRCEREILGRDAFTDLLAEANMKVRLNKHRTTDSSHGLPTYPNLIKDFIPTAPNQLWVSDITYITIWWQSDLGIYERNAPILVQFFKNIALLLVLCCIFA